MTDRKFSPHDGVSNGYPSWSRNLTRLIEGGFSLLDTQFITGHLASFGAEEIPRSEFHTRLNYALMTDADFDRLAHDTPPEEIIRIIRDNARRGA